MSIQKINRETNKMSIFNSVKIKIINQKLWCNNTKIIGYFKRMWENRQEDCPFMQKPRITIKIDLIGVGNSAYT